MLELRGYLPDPCGYIPDLLRYAMDPLGYVVDPLGDALDPRRYVPDPRRYVPDPFGYALELIRYVLDPRGSVLYLLRDIPRADEVCEVPSAPVIERRMLASFLHSLVTAPRAVNLIFQIAFILPSAILPHAGRKSLL